MCMTVEVAVLLSCPGAMLISYPSLAQWGSVEMDKPTSPEMILKDADRIFGHSCKLLQRSGNHAPQFILFYPDRIVPTAVMGRTRDELHTSSWELIRQAVHENLVGYYFINEAWVRVVPNASTDNEVICAECGENHVGRSTAQCSRFIPVLRSGKMVSELPDRREILMMCAVTRVGRRLLQRTFHHEGKHIVFDGEAKEVDSSGFNYFADLLAEADRARGSQ
jgi:hypothetical protein